MNSAYMCTVRVFTDVQLCHHIFTETHNVHVYTTCHTCRASNGFFPLFVLKCTHTHTYIYTHTHTHRRRHTHISDTHTHTHTHIDTYTHIRYHTCKVSRSFRCPSALWLRSLSSAASCSFWRFSSSRCIALCFSISSMRLICCSRNCFS
jgi:hypothetical protein